MGSSSGSTGQPVKYLHDNNARSAGRAASYYGWLLTGWNFGDRGLHIWGNPNAVNVQWKKFPSKVKSKIFNVYKYPAFKLNDPNGFNEIISIIKKNKFSYVDGYTNAIYLLAKFIEVNNVMAVGRFKRVLTTGENLHGYQRDLIEKVLGPVYDCYGCGEINGIAYQNQFEKEYAIMDTNVYVEYDYNYHYSNNEKPLVITHLHNFVMPFIKYKNGDMAISSNLHSEKLGFSFLRTIEGRVSDIIELPNGGNLVVPAFLEVNYCGWLTVLNNIK